MMRKSLIAAAVFGALSLPTIHMAHAEEAAAAPALTGNFGLFSEYRFRGIAQTQKKPAIQGGFDYAHSSGLYVGNWNSNVSEAAGFPGGNLEMDFYGGYKTTLGDFGLDVGGIYYYYPGSVAASGDAVNNKELYIGGSWKFLSAKYYRVFGNYFSDVGTAAEGGTKGTGYLDVSASYDLGGGLGLNAHVGHLNYQGRDNASYTDWKVGVTQDVGGWVLGAAYVGTNAKDNAGEFYNFVTPSTGRAVKAGSDTVVLSVSKTF